MIRQRQGGKRLDLTPLKEILKDARRWTALGTVFLPDGESQHYELVADGVTVDVLVDVQLQPSGSDVTCRLGASGGNNRGLWQIPNVGDEVCVLIPEGHEDWMPAIVTVLSSGKIPDGVAVNVTVIADGKVLIHDGDGGAEPLVKETAYKAHVHPSGTGATGTPNNAASSTSYTEILEAK